MIKDQIIFKKAERYALENEMSFDLALRRVKIFQAAPHLDDNIVGHLNEGNEELEVSQNTWEQIVEKDTRNLENNVKFEF